MLLFITTALAGMSSSAITGTLEVSVDDVIAHSPDEIRIATLDGEDLGRVTVFCRAARTGDLRCSASSSRGVDILLGEADVLRDGTVEFDYVAGRDSGWISIEPNPTPIGIAPLPSP